MTSSTALGSISTRKNAPGIHVSMLPYSVQQRVQEMKLDVDEDGKLDSGVIGMALDQLSTLTKCNTDLKRMVRFLLFFALLLTGCVFGATIAAARLAKKKTIDASSGIMYAKGSCNTIKTEDVNLNMENSNIALMTNDELDNLKQILLMEGDVKFQIKGYARAPNGLEAVKLLVEGGTITYDSTGLIADATGDAKELLEFAFPELTTTTNTTTDRYLAGSACGSTTTTTGTY